MDAFSKAVQKLQVGHGFSEGVVQVVSVLIHSVSVKFLVVALLVCIRHAWSH